MPQSGCSVALSDKGDLVVFICDSARVCVVSQGVSIVTRDTSKIWPRTQRRLSHDFPYHCVLQRRNCSRIPRFIRLSLGNLLLQQWAFFLFCRGSTASFRRSLRVRPLRCRAYSLSRRWALRQNLPYWGGISTSHSCRRRPHAPPWLSDSLTPFSSSGPYHKILATTNSDYNPTTPG